MSTLLICVLGLFLPSVIQCSKASKVSLTASPTILRDGLTDRFQLRCSLESAEAPDTMEGRQISQSHTNYDIKHVNSIIISRAEHNSETQVPVAHIITSENAVAYTDLDTLSVTGDLTPINPSDSEYLELTWSRPGQNQSGVYTCEINALDLMGHCVTLTSDIAIEDVAPEVQELLNHIVSLKDFVADYTKETAETIAGMNQTITDLKTTVDGMKVVLGTLKAPHYENGYVNCGSSRDWPLSPFSEPGVQRKISSVVFQTPYDKPPMITTAVVVSKVMASQNAVYHAELLGVDTTGFNISCNTWQNTVLDGISIRWTSSVA